MFCLSLALFLCANWGYRCLMCFCHKTRFFFEAGKDRVFLYIMDRTMEKCFCPLERWRRGTCPKSPRSFPSHVDEWLVLHGRRHVSGRGTAAGFEASRASPYRGASTRMQRGVAPLPNIFRVATVNRRSGRCDWPHAVAEPAQAAASNDPGPGGRPLGGL